MQSVHYELKLGIEQRTHRGWSTAVSSAGPECESDTHAAIRSILNLRRGPIRYPRNKVICLEGDPADQILLVTDGALRTCRAFKDGRRSVVAFHIAGDLFGFTGEATYSLCTEAASSSKVFHFSRKAIKALAVRDNRVASFLLANTATELKRLQEHAVLMNRSAQCRVVTFLIDLSARLGEETRLDLPVSHRDIADFLGLSIETLSRAITELERAQYIVRISTRTLILKDRLALMRIMS